MQKWCLCDSDFLDMKPIVDLYFWAFAKRARKTFLKFCHTDTTLKGIVLAVKSEMTI